MAVTSSSSLWFVRDAGGNKAVVKYEVYATTSGSSYNNYDITTSVWVDGQSATGVHKLPSNTTTTCFSGEFTISNASGKYITASYSIPTGISAGTLTGSTSMTIPSLVTTPTMTTSVTARGLNTISASMSITNNGGANIIDRYIELFTDSACTNKVGTISGANSGTFSSLTPNTTYYVRANASNGSFRGYSSVVQTSTYNYATITSAPNLTHGNNLTVSYTNPSGSSLQIGLLKTDGSTVLASYRACTGSSYTFVFTDSELDNIYKQYGNNSTFSARVYLKTANTYSVYSGITITLTGNQKTMHEKVNGTWLRGKVYRKISGNWLNVVIWRKVSGTWRRGI